MNTTYRVQSNNICHENGILRSKFFDPYEGNEVEFFEMTLTKDEGNENFVMSQNFFRLDHLSEVRFGD